MFEFCRTPAGPRQTKIIPSGVVAGFLVNTALGAQGFDIKQMHVAHVRLQALGCLAGVANGPDRAVDFPQDVLGHGLIQAFDLLHLEVFGQLFTKAQLVGKLLHDHVITAAFPQRLDDLLAPLQRAIGCGARTTGLKLRGRRQ